MKTTLNEAAHLIKKLKALPRSIRKCIPLIAKKTGKSPGYISHYLDGFGHDVPTCEAILKAAKEILDNPVEDKIKRTRKPKQHPPIGRMNQNLV